MGKLFTSSILHDRLKQYSEVNRIINKTQAAFRQGLFVLLKCVADLFKWRKRKLLVLFLDHKKAFDMEWREKLRYKLVRDNVDGKLLNNIHSMYNNNIKSCVVMVQQKKPDKFTCNMGVRQGENLPLLFFAFYILMTCRKSLLNEIVIT